MGRLKTTGRPSMKATRIRSKGWYGDDWKTLADSIKRRDGYRCQIARVSKYACNRYCPPPFASMLAAHHIVPLPRGTNHPENLVTLCHDCHSKLHGRDVGHISAKQDRASRMFTKSR